MKFPDFPERLKDNNLMKYLSFDIEATGLEEHDLIIEFGCIPVDVTNNQVLEQLSFHSYIQCPPFETLRPKLNQWVIENNESLINKAHNEGITLENFKNKFNQYIESNDIKEIFGDEKIILLGKSLNAIDLPFLNRDLGWEWMRSKFSHRTVDVSSVVYSFIDSGILPDECSSGSELMNYLKMGDVAHTALEDSINVAKIYLELILKVKNN